MKAADELEVIAIAILVSQKAMSNEEVDEHNGTVGLEVPTAHKGQDLVNV